MVDPRKADQAIVDRVRDTLSSRKVVSIDETCFYVVDRLRYGYAVRGRRARLMTDKPRKVSNVRRCTVLAAIASDGVVDFELMEGSCNQDVFSRFVSRLDVPIGTVLLMDNVRFHDTKRVRDAISARGFESVFTPPYSPWCNPIELAFSKIKTAYRTHAQSHPSSDVDDFVGRINGSLMSVSDRDCKAFFSHVMSLVSVPLDRVAMLLG
jgi:transposase